MEINAIMSAKNIPDGYGKTSTSISSLKEKDRETLLKLFIRWFDVNGNGKLEQDELKTFNLAIKKYNKDFKLSSKEVKALDAEYRKMMDLIIELGGKNDKEAAEKLKKIGAPTMPTLLKVTLNFMNKIIVRLENKLNMLHYMYENPDDSEKPEKAELDKAITLKKAEREYCKKQKRNIQKLLKEIESSSF